MRDRERCAPLAPRREKGFATLLALSATAVGLLVAAALASVAIESARDARSGHAGALVRAGSEVAVWQFARNSGAVGRTIPVGARASLGVLPVGAAVRATATLERVGRELYLLRGEARHGAEGVSARVGHVLWSLDPGARLLANAGVVATAGSVTQGPGGTIQGTGITTPLPGWAVMCAPVQATVDSLIPSRAMAAVAKDTAVTVSLGRLDFIELMRMANASATGTVTPAPVRGPTGCIVTSPGNWGSPAGSGPCARYRPLIVTAGDLNVIGGSGQGVLAVAGSLTLSAGARYAGVLLVGGDVRLQGGAVVQGIVRAGGNVSITNARIVGNACAAALALSRPQFGSSIPVPGGWLDPI